MFCLSPAWPAHHHTAPSTSWGFTLHTSHQWLMLLFSASQNFLCEMFFLLNLSSQPFQSLCWVWLEVVSCPTRLSSRDQRNIAKRCGRLEVLSSEMVNLVSKTFHQVSAHLIFIGPRLRLRRRWSSSILTSSFLTSRRTQAWNKITTFVLAYNYICCNFLWVFRYFKWTNNTLTC